MNRTDFTALYRYNQWANERVSDSVVAIPIEAFTRHLGGSHPTIRDAFAHLTGAEWIWLERWLGNAPTARPDWYTSSDPAVLVDRLREVEERRASFLGRLSESDLDSTCSFHYLNGQPGGHLLRDLLFHVANHSTFHRGQIVSMLRQAGTVPPATDFTHFCAELA